MNKQQDGCIAMEYGFTVGHEDWRTLGKHRSHLLVFVLALSQKLDFFVRFSIDCAFLF